MKIEIEKDKVIVDGREYRYVDIEKEMCGRREIAEMLGYRHKDGSINQSNLFRNNPNAIYKFPNFEIDRAEKGAKPWTRAEVKAWLSIPLNERKRMYKESLDEIEE